MSIYIPTTTGNYVTQSQLNKYATNSSLSSGLSNKFDKVGGTVSGPIYANVMYTNQGIGSTGNNSLLMTCQGDAFGGMSCYIRNRSDFQGILNVNETGELVDLSHQTTTNKGGRLRYENRSANISTRNSNGEYQLFTKQGTTFTNSYPYAVFGEKSTVFSGTGIMVGIGFNTLSGPKADTPLAKLHLSGDIPSSVLTATQNTGGVNFRVDSNTVNQTTTGGTVTNIASASIGKPTINSSQTTTYTNAHSLYIDGQPLPGINTTLANSYALYVNTGNIYFGGYTTVFLDLYCKANLLIQSQNQLKLFNTGNSVNCGLRGSNSMASNIVMTLPPSLPATYNNQALVSDTSGNLSFQVGVPQYACSMSVGTASSQSITSASGVVSLLLDTADVNTYSIADTTNYRFNLPSNGVGLYQVHCRLNIATSASISNIYFRLYSGAGLSGYDFEQIFAVSPSTTMYFFNAIVYRGNSGLIQVGLVNPSATSITISSAAANPAQQSRCIISRLS